VSSVRKHWVFGSDRPMSGRRLNGLGRMITSPPCQPEAYPTTMETGTWFLSQEQRR